jgi:hypothetical protein
VIEVICTFGQCSSNSFSSFPATSLLVPAVIFTLKGSECASIPSSLMVLIGCLSQLLVCTPSLSLFPVDIVRVLV